MIIPTKNGFIFYPKKQFLHSLQILSLIAKNIPIPPGLNPCHTFYEQVNLFFENKGHENPRLAYVGLMHAYTGMDLRTQLRFHKL